MYKAAPLGMRPSVMNKGTCDRVALESLTIHDARDQGVLAKSAVGEEAHFLRERRPYAHRERKAELRAVSLRACGTEPLQ